jgi:prevent-host-death family protein
MFVLSSNDKGNIAEAAIVSAAIKAGVNVLKPQFEHGRYDLAFDLGERIHRVQCKWARLAGEVLIVNLTSSRRTSTGAEVRSTYSAAEIDAVAVYCEALDTSYLMPIRIVEGLRAIQLRLSAPKNGQQAGLNWAADYELPGAVAQLGERRRGTPEATGSSPVSSTSDTSVALAAHEYRQKLGWYMERAAAGERFLITRRGKPYARLSPPHEQRDLPQPEPAQVIPITEAGRADA